MTMKHNWTYKPLANLCNVFVDGDWIESKDQSNSGIRLIQTGNIGVGVYLDKTERSKFISEETFYSLNCTEIFEGDILISRLPDPIGRACILPKLSSRAITAVDVAIVRPKSEILPRFVLHYTKSENYADCIATFTKGSTRKRVSRKNLGSIKFPVPPLEVQRHIVVELDKINNTIEDCREVLRSLDALAQSLFYDYFGDPVTNPKGFKCNKLGQQNEISSAKRVLVQDVVDSGIPFIRGTELALLSKQNSFDSSIFTMFITPGHYEKVKAITGVPKLNDLLIPSINPDGYVWEVNTTDPLYFKDGRVLWVHVNHDVYSSKWLKFALSKVIIEKFANLRGAVFAELTLVFLRNLDLIVPPIELQEKFAERIEQIEEQKKDVEETIANLQTLLDSRMDYWFN